MPHPHILGGKTMVEPHMINVSPLLGYKAAFEGLVRIDTPREHIEKNLLEKLVKQIEFKSNRSATAFVYEKCKQIVSAANVKEINLHQAFLRFEASEKIDSEYKSLCSPVFSTPVNNEKSACYGELKITVVGSCCGNDSVFLFVHKVSKGKSTEVLIFPTVRINLLLLNEIKYSFY